MWTAGLQDYRVFRSGRFVGYVHKRFAGADYCDIVVDLLVSPPSSVKVLHRGYLNREMFAINVLINGCPQEMFLKSIRCKSYWHLIFMDPLMPSVTLRYLALAETLQAIGIHTPSIIAIVEEQSLFGTKRSFILTERIRNALTLKDIMAAPSRSCSGSESAERRAIIHCLAEMVHQLHSNKIFHFDLNLRNILLSDERSGAHFLTLVDLDAAVILPAKADMLSNLLRFADLLILNKHFYPVTHLKERLRFLAAYSGKTLSMRRYRRTLFFLVSTPALLHVYRCLEAIRLIHLLRRALICLRIVR